MPVQNIIKETSIMCSCSFLQDPRKPKNQLYPVFDIATLAILVFYVVLMIRLKLLYGVIVIKID